MSIKVKTISTTAIRALLGLIYVFFGLNFFLHFLPMPPPPAQPGAAEGFMSGLFQTGYFLPMVKGLEILLGGFLLLNLFTPLVLILLAPISLNILLFHAFLAPENMAISVLIVLLQVYLFWVYQKSYRNVLARTVQVS